MMIPVEKLIQDIKRFDNELKSVSAVCQNAKSLKGRPEFKQYEDYYLKYFHMNEAYTKLMDAVEDLTVFVNNDNDKVV